MTNKTILVTGSRGQLGQELQHLAPQNSDFSWVFTHRGELDVCDHQAVASMVAEIKPAIIINCTAYTAVDKAEKEPDHAAAINHFAVKNLAQVAAEHNACLIHVSTDYVFNGKNHRPYLESDTPEPQGIYGQTKLEGELAMQASGVRGIIIRTSWVYSAFGNNFVNTMRKLGKSKDALSVVVDQIGSPTWAADLAQAIVDICRHETLKDKRGEIFHYSNEGVCSWYDLAREVMQMQHLNCKVGAINSVDYPTPAARPHYSVLDKSLIKKEFDIEIRHWRESLALVLTQFSKIESA